MKTAPSRTAATALAALAIALLSGCAASGAGAGAGGPPASVATDAPKAAPAPRAAPRRAPAPSARVREQEPPESLPPNDLTPQVMFQLLAAEIAAQRGQIGSATVTYVSLALQTRDPRIARRATELALAERSLERALQSARLWVEFAPQSTMAAQTLEMLLLSIGSFGEAEPLVAQRLAKARADRTSLDEFYANLSRTLVRAADKRGALALFDRIAAQDADLPEARLAAAALAHAAGEVDRAAAEALRARALNPDDERAAVVAAHYVQDTSAGPAGAAKLLEQFIERHPQATEARFQYARLLAADGRTDAARRQMELALRSEPENPTILFSLAQIAYQTKQLKVAEDYLERYLALPPTVPRDNAPALLFLAELDEEQGRLEQGIARLAQITSGEQRLPAVLRRAVLLGKLGRVDDARALLRGTSVPTSAERVQLTVAEAQVLRDAQRHVEAFEVLDKALERTPDSPDLLYDHAMAAERLDRLDAVEKSLRRLIELRPDNAHAYNALGYTFADRNIRLDEAQALIERALALSPDDAHIIDSMGWVLFRRGRLEEALEWLERAFKAKPEADIAAHLGEVLWQLGRLEQARKVWAEAKGREPNNTTLRETLARLNVAL